jgi:hypothetical protein
VLDFITGSLQRVYPFLSWQLARQRQNTYTVVKVEDMLEGKVPFRLFLLKSRYVRLVNAPRSGMLPINEQFLMLSLMRVGI